MLICNCKCNSYGKPPTNGVGSANGSRSLTDKPLCLQSVDWVMDAFSRQANTDTGNDSIISSLHP